MSVGCWMSETLQLSKVLTNITTDSSVSSGEVFVFIHARYKFQFVQNTIETIEK
jgi:hypothetical protein